MTTVGVEPTKVERVNAMQIPSYAYHYPSFKRVKLAAVKQSLFHPNIPTFRRMEMDSNRGLLPDEHSRTSTTCGPDDFARATSTPFLPPQQRFYGLNITETGRQIHRCYTTPEELTNAREEWSIFLNKCPERYDIRLPDIPNKKDFHFTDYAIRYLRPDVTRSWKYTLRQEPMLDQYGQRPIPANIYGRYRDTFPLHFRDVAAEAWH